MSDKTDFEDNLYSLFKSMTDGDDATLATGIAREVKKYVMTAKCETVDSGKVPTGTLVAKGEGGFKFEDEASGAESLCSATILTACKTMTPMVAGGNAVLSTAIATGIDTMCSYANAIVTKVNGTATNEQTSVQTAITNAVAKGKFTGVSATIVAGLNTAFTMMDSEAFKKQKRDGDAYLAEQLADLVTAYITAGAVETKGFDPSISGSSGIGVLSWEE